MNNRWTKYCLLYSRVILAAGSVTFVMTAMGQNVMTKRMNEVKLSPEKYIYHQSIHSLADSALAMATFNLFHKVNKGDTDSVSLDELKQCLRHITSTHDSMTRQFVYVDIGDLTAIRNKHHHRTKDVEETDTYTPPEMVSQIIALHDLKAVYGFLKAETNAGRLFSYGSLQSVTGLSDCHIVVCDSITLKPIVILSVEDDNRQRVNLVTNQADSLDNYHGTYVLWYKQKQNND